MDAPTTWTVFPWEESGPASGVAAAADAVFGGVQFHIVHQAHAQFVLLVLIQTVGSGSRLDEGLDVQDGLSAATALAGGAEGVLLLGVRKEENRKYQGRTLAQAAEMDGTDAIETLMALVRRIKEPEVHGGTDA